MKIEQNIAHAFLFVDGKFKANVHSLGSESVVAAFVWFEYFWVIGKSRRPDEHECELFTNAIMGVVNKLKVGWLLLPFVLLVWCHLRSLGHFFEADFHIY